MLAGCARTRSPALIYWRADRVREWQLHVVLAAGTTILTLANYYAGPTALYPLLYIVDGAVRLLLLRAPRGARPHRLIGVAYALVLAVQDPASAVVRWLLAVGTPLVAGLLISRLLGQLRSGRAESDERERALQQSEARTRLVLDSAPDAFVALDRDGDDHDLEPRGRAPVRLDGGGGDRRAHARADHPGRVP